MRTLIMVDTRAYTRTHGRTPRTVPGKGLWAFTLDDAEVVVVRYGTYPEALRWAKAQATMTVTVVP